MHRAKEDLLASCHFPKDYWYKIWTTNLLERMKEEIKQFTRDALIETSGIWMFDLIESCKVKTIYGRALSSDIEN